MPKIFKFGISEEAEARILTGAPDFKDVEGVVFLG